jgi:hypothetical protein
MYSGYSGYKDMSMTGELRGHLELGELAEMKFDEPQLRQRRNNRV